MAEITCSWSDCPVLDVCQMLAQYNVTCDASSERYLQYIVQTLDLPVTNERLTYALPVLSNKKRPII